MDEQPRRYKDVSYLTPFEEKIYALRKQGKSRKEIAEELGLSSNTVNRRVADINEKIALKEIWDAQDRRISWG
jgi:DNA-binding CsgD family transcriptional regulator